MSSLFSQAQTFVWNILHRPQLNDIFDVLIVAALIYELIILLRETRASEVLKGFVLLILAFVVSNLLRLTTMNWLLSTIINNGAVVLVILFQPELRRVLEQLGRGAKIEHYQNDSGENERIKSEVTQCLISLSRRRVGALIVFERRTGLKDVVETGTRLDSVISAPLLENIFEPNTPLHDGAVVIRGTRVLAAACVLTLSESSAITRDLGTRHRAAIGISETTDAEVFIVSEETGIISLARGGKLIRHLDAKAVGEVLEAMYARPRASVMEGIKKLLERRPRDAKKQ